MRGYCLLRWKYKITIIHLFPFEVFWNPAFIKVILFFNMICNLSYINDYSITDANLVPNPAKLLQLINSGAGPLWLMFAVVIGVLGELVSWGGCSLWTQRHWNPTLKWTLIILVLLKLDIWNIFHVLQNIFIFSLPVFLSPQIFSFLFSSLFTSFHPKVSFSTRWKVRVKPYWSSSRLTVRAGKLWTTFFQRCNLPFLFMVCHYLLQPFIPSPSWSFSLSIDLML